MFEISIWIWISYRRLNYLSEYGICILAGHSSRLILWKPFVYSQNAISCKGWKKKRNFGEHVTCITGGKEDWHGTNWRSHHSGMNPSAYVLTFWVLIRDGPNIGFCRISSKIMVALAMETNIFVATFAGYPYLAFGSPDYPIQCKLPICSNLPTLFNWNTTSIWSK